MERYKDIQRQREISRQRGYGETGTEERDLMDAHETPLPGYRKGDGTQPQPDRGVFRDDGGAKPGAETEDTQDRAGQIVTDPDDPRTSNWPETYDVDHGPKPDGPTGDDPRPDGTRMAPERLEDGYSLDENTTPDKSR